MTRNQEKSSSQEPPRATNVDDEPDEWDQRINRTGCAAENEKLTDCWHDKKDWRACAAEMAAFQKCWKQNRNDVRTGMKDVEE